MEMAKLAQVLKGIKIWQPANSFKTSLADYSRDPLSGERLMTAGSSNSQDHVVGYIPNLFFASLGWENLL